VGLIMASRNSRLKVLNPVNWRLEMNTNKPRLVKLATGSTESRVDPAYEVVIEVLTKRGGPRGGFGGDELAEIRKFLDRSGIRYGSKRMPSHNGHILLVWAGNEEDIRRLVNLVDTNPKAREKWSVSTEIGKTSPENVKGYQDRDDEWEDASKYNKF